MRRAKQSGLTFKLRVEKLFGQFLDSLTVNEDTLTKIKRECVSILPKYTYTMWYMQCKSCSTGTPSSRVRIAVA